MTLDECRAALAAAETTPTEALAAAMELAAELVPEVTTLLARAAADEPLLLAEERLARYGLAALAAARRTEVFPALARMCARSRVMWTRVVGGLAGPAIPPLVTALFDGDPALLYARLADPATSPDLRKALFLALGWLARAGQTERAALAGALAAFADTDPAPDDPAWLGWLAAAGGLGLDDQMEQMRERLTDAPRDMYAVDEDDWLREIEEACAPDALDVAAPILDPVSMFPAPDETLEPAWPYDLSADELSWLDWQLLTLGERAEALPLEAVDGYFTALHVTPATAEFAACEAPIWNDATATDRLGRPEVAEAARALLARHFDWIGARLAGYALPDPFFEMEDETTDGILWVRGFYIGLERHSAIWDRLARRPAVRELLEPLTLLEGDPPETDDDAPTGGDLSPELRAILLDALPETIVELRQLVRDIPLRPEVRVGRNDPCPCGSGKKYKKCCGAPTAVPAS